MDESKMALEPLTTLLTELKDLTAQKIQKEKEWLAYKGRPNPEPTKRPLDMYSYSSLAKLDKRQEVLLAKMEDGMGDYSVNFSEAISKEFATKMKRYLDLFLIENFKALPDSYRSGKWSAIDRSQGVNKYYFTYKAPKTSYDGPNEAQLNTALEDLSDWVNRIQGFIDRTRSGKLHKNEPGVKKKRQRERPEIPLVQLFVDKEKWEIFLRICDYLSEERDFDDKTIQFVRKIDNKYTWKGPRGAGLPPLASFMYILDQAGFILPNKR